MRALKRRRRRRLRARPVPDGWRQILEQNVPYWRLLDPGDRAELEGHIQVFVAEKHFEGCGGFTITDEVRVTIAAQACVLLLHRETDYFPALVSVVVYPSHYVAPTGLRPGGVVDESPQVRVGESWQRGTVVLSWDHVVQGAADAHDGSNVVFHEFAHQLDAETGSDDGAPALPRRSMYPGWAQVLGGAYRDLVNDVRSGRSLFLDPYGAASPAEFFAVVTESFFERPAELRRARADVYDQLSSYYLQDPASRFAADPVEDGGGGVPVIRLRGDALS